MRDDGPNVPAEARRVVLSSLLCGPAEHIRIPPLTILFRTISLSLQDNPDRKAFLSSSHTERNVSRENNDFPKS